MAYRVERATQTDQDLKAIFNVLFETASNFGGLDDIGAGRAEPRLLEIEAAFLTLDKVGTMTALILKGRASTETQI
ncbi:hypothetical protein K3757_11005 [Sulfitobacter sp. S223]|uniref:hypothetical protein n=1 Tax=Sulfitobacter sp. S223 TaxID=2867023 RepID=UPI0021A65E5B|nr:hypothetical protein [Sulfitobacter sp. S223]UWR25009.1 hypothetical protein K3757_11005 [Sulfitobacter sp. S223]